MSTNKNTPDAHQHDSSWGSFLEGASWDLPMNPQWLTIAERRREDARAKARDWVTPRRMPGWRAVTVALRLGRAVAMWVPSRVRGNREESKSKLFRLIVDAMEDLGPAFVKLAQIISAGEGVFPDELVTQCKRLRDQARAEDTHDVRARVEASLGCEISGVFSSFEETPMAAASIAQVHAAVLRDGTPVVVKVRRRDIERIVERDVRALAWLAPKLIGRLPFAALANPPALVELFAETIIEELDFQIEAASMLHVAKALAAHGRRGVVVARPHPAMVRADVLVQERIEGMNLSEVGTAGVDGLKVVQSLLACVLEGALIEGVFHGDLHAGNMFVLSDGRVALIDFGITANLSEVERVAFARLVTAGMSGDWREQLRALAQLGALPMDADFDELGVELGLDKPVDVAMLSADEMSQELQRLSKALLSSGAKLPKALMLWAKNVVFIDAAIGEIAPECDVLSVLGEVAMRFVMQHSAALTGELGREVVVDERAIRTSLGVDAEIQSMTWRELSERRALIASRAKTLR